MTDAPAHGTDQAAHGSACGFRNDGPVSGLERRASEVYGGRALVPLSYLLSGKSHLPLLDRAVRRMGAPPLVSRCLSLQPTPLTHTLHTTSYTLNRRPCTLSPALLIRTPEPSTLHPKSEILSPKL